MGVKGGERQSGTGWHGLHIVFDKRLKLIKLMSLAVFCLAAADSIVAAQSLNKTSQIIAPNIFSIESAVETNWPIRVITSEKSAFVIIKGLPETVALSTGRLFESGIWAIQVTQLQELKIVAIADNEEKWDVDLSLKTLEGKVLAALQSSLQILPAGGEVAQTAEPQQETSTVSRFSTVTTARGNTWSAETEYAPKSNRKIEIAPPVISEAEMERILRMMKKGIERMNNGNISGARLFFSRAAAKGWADGALYMARSYDEAELQTIGTVGVKPEPALAAKWYTRAIELGSITAFAYLKRLK